MKPIILNTLLLLCLVFQRSGFAQSAQKTIDGSINIPLKIGKNPSVYFETLEIEPVNLFMELDANNKNIPPIQLELKIMENDTEYTTFLWYDNDSTNSPKTNFPKAFNRYAFRLRTNTENVVLAIEKLDFGAPFFIDLGQTAIVENFTILFETCTGEWSEDLNGNQVDVFNSYSVSLSNENEQHSFSFTSLDTSANDKLVIPWKNYKLLVLADSEEALKVLVLDN
ncbi:hypothetical protein ACJOV8_011665 [Formosa sp. 3Alg 14/1]|uniref:hypothetical protein n=1 Tax=Formosa sp. 3Alg 14/1 TaxID=3382190 RepID=UPI0039BE80B9